MTRSRSSAGRIRVVVADDSRFMQRVISDVLTSDAQIEVVGLAANGDEAVKAVLALKPHVLTMDVHMPHADGLTAVGRIMRECPTPVLMISSLTREGSAAAIRALELGAIDFVSKPSGSVDLGLEWLREDIVRKVKVAARVRPVRTAGHPTAPADLVAPRPALFSAPSNGHGGTDAVKPVLAIAASTGGPAAFLGLIPRFPSGIPAAVLIVQHMPRPYTTQFAKELAARSSVPVKEAEEGEMLECGVAYVAPGHHHLTVSDEGRLDLRSADPKVGECPSANRALISVAEYAGAAAIGVVLTGMGRDGAAGVRTIRRAGGINIAQDEASSVVYGMPRAAVETGCVDAVLGLSDLPDFLLACLGGAGVRRSRISHAS